MLLLLLRSRKATVAESLSAGLPLAVIADHLVAAIAGGVMVGRANARKAGVDRLEFEAASLGLVLNRRRVAHDIFIADAVRANQAARSYGARWLRKAEGDTVHEAALTANAETAGSLRRIGVTESSEAFSAGRTAALRESHLRVVRVWDSQLDACPICWGYDGDEVGANESFSQGEPGSIHPHCACGYHIATTGEYAEAA